MKGMIPNTASGAPACRREGDPPCPVRWFESGTLQGRFVSKCMQCLADLWVNYPVRDARGQQSSHRPAREVAAECEGPDRRSRRLGHVGTRRSLPQTDAHAYDDSAGNKHGDVGRRSRNDGTHDVDDASCI